MPLLEHPDFKWLGRLGDLPNIVGATGGVIAFIGSNKDWDPAAPKEDQRHYDLYITQRDKEGYFPPPRRVSYENLTTQGFQLSSDGKMAALRARDPAEDTPFDVYIINIETGEVFKPQIAKRIEEAFEAEIRAELLGGR